MDGRDALPGAAPDGKPGVNQGALGRKRDRTEAEILLAQKRRQDGDGQTPRTMVAGSWCAGRPAKEAICLISTMQSRNGRSKCWPPALKRPCHWRNWKFICARTSRSRYNRD